MRNITPYRDRGVLARLGLGGAACKSGSGYGSVPRRPGSAVLLTALLVFVTFAQTAHLHHWPQLERSGESVHMGTDDATVSHHELEQSHLTCPVCLLQIHFNIPQALATQAGIRTAPLPIGSPSVSLFSPEQGSARGRAPPSSLG